MSISATAAKELLATTTRLNDRIKVYAEQIADSEQRAASFHAENATLKTRVRTLEREYEELKQSIVQPQPLMEDVKPFRPDSESQRTIEALTNELIAANNTKDELLQRLQKKESMKRTKDIKQKAKLDAEREINAQLKLDLERHSTKYETMKEKLREHKTTVAKLEARCEEAEKQALLVEQVVTPPDPFRFLEGLQTKSEALNYSLPRPLRTVLQATHFSISTIDVQKHSLFAARSFSANEIILEGNRALVVLGDVFFDPAVTLEGQWRDTIEKPTVGKRQEVFHRNAFGWIYVGTFECVDALRTSLQTFDKHPNIMNHVCQRTLAVHDNLVPAHVRGLVRGLYISGALQVACFSLQRVGFNRELYDSLLGRYAPATVIAPPGGEPAHLKRKESGSYQGSVEAKKRKT